MTLILSLTARANDPHFPAPPAVRVRQALKLLLRGFGIRAKWATPQIPAPLTHDRPSGRNADAPTPR